MEEQQLIEIFNKFPKFKKFRFIRIRDVAFVDFDNVTWSSSTITARGALIFNDTNSDTAVAVLDFGSDKSSTSGDFTIQFPTPDATNAIIRIV